MTLLFITQKLHGQDAFVISWIKEFENRGYEVSVLCLEWQPEEAARVLGTALPPLTVHSLGKERGYGRIRQIGRFLHLISTLQYDRVFIHMTPIWGAVGAPVWIARRTPTYLWYTHYKMQLGLWMLGLYGKRLFCATGQSLPQYEGNPKKVVTGHGIAAHLWARQENTATDSHQLLMVHRLARSKRVELGIQALHILPGTFTLDIYGQEVEPAYARELKKLVKTLKLEERVHFCGSAAIKDLPGIYASHRLILNLASETIDKTMIEAMTCGCYPVTTKRNAEAIGITQAPSDDTAETIADFIVEYGTKPPMSGEELFEVAHTRHSLQAVVQTMDNFIRSGF